MQCFLFFSQQDSLAVFFGSSLTFWSPQSASSRGCQSCLRYQCKHSELRNLHFDGHGWQNSVNLGHLSSKMFCNGYAKGKPDIKTWPSKCSVFVNLKIKNNKNQKNINDENILLIRPVAPVLPLCISTPAELKYLIETNCFIVNMSYGAVVLSCF